ncbi:MAG: endopeptidase La [Gammaproteobacteria bacterium]|jgi:ATP-dependent Lon protease|nr:endopeptidase La [Gammaproteobacteria bacterium]
MDQEKPTSGPSSNVLAMPVLPLRDVVVYPHMVIPLFVGRDKSIKALDAAMADGEKQILLVAQREATEDNPSVNDIYSLGSVSTILQLLKLPDGTVKVLVEGIKRGKVLDYIHTDPYFLANVENVDDLPSREEEAEVLTRTLMGQFEKYVKLNKKIPPEIVTSVSSIDDPGRLADTIAAHMSLKIQEKQNVLEIIPLRERLERLMALMESEIDLLQVEQRIRSNVKRQMEKSQREYYLNEQMKAIQEELGHEASEHEDLKDRIEKAGMSQEAYGKATAELKKLKMMAPMSAEATVSRNYIDWMLQVPWKKKTKLRLDLPQAEAILEEDHYGLEKVKERIIEYLAVQKRVKKLKGPILCLVGPPGVGKTSLGKSIARATQRTFVRMSLGGVRDEAEIRGHRRTYIGAMPGKILQKLAKAGVRNPLFLLDEIDKMAMDFRGDPAAALLEVLDPEQNNTFNDHYLEVDYDLSDIMFVATANSLNIPPPLLDRMEVIRLAGYTEDEKLNIAERYLIPKQIHDNGLNEGELSITREAILGIIRYYTREAGVRNLEREISKLSRKVVKEILMQTEAKQLVIDENNLENYLGVKRFRFGLAEDHDQVGQVTGLAWTEVGGDILTIEAVVIPGKGKTTTTGKLGEVMQESIQAAMSVVRSRAKLLGIPTDFYEKSDIHIHVPEGATPKDGPSAGIGMCTALVSVLTNIPVRADVAMTGEITLRGEVLPIGGLKEKLLAARRAGIAEVIIPEENRRDLKEIPKNVQEDLKIHCVKWIDEVFQIALTRLPQPLSEGTKSETPEEAPKEDNQASDMLHH